ncbi:hypothetical protein PC116_g10938 [Phytophthora cactorum]|uniref:Uncharacterized protein n=1 Tax=Phytophthora cactorum TaxID=29920 RepID=A0A8T1L061_9STRA|nr:hypothetical protein PC112_g7842 [Phytophthora cactorum]KAG2830864.1 hypothetical protein PC111_g7223 [Phytophthora cactorum]KAG2860440.1 hypothetical protein PC113_g8073 [Phytophthora cactorum]KAG2914851.1 hypothetical protein PC114_g8039 [Phytophthora cactorum]KAG2945993.1 hypothetical protein PC117_g8026 [Phytophthora cactorum]
MQFQREQGLKTADASAGVVCIAFHPFGTNFFLVGYAAEDSVSALREPTQSHELDALKDISPVELASSLYTLVLSAEKMRTSRPAIAGHTNPRVSPF